MVGGEACFGHNTTPSASLISRRLSGLLPQRGAAFNRQHPFVDILLSDIVESEEVLDVGELVREPPPASFQRMSS